MAVVFITLNGQFGPKRNCKMDIVIPECDIILSVAATQNEKKVIFNIWKLSYAYDISAICVSACACVQCTYQLGSL